MFEGEENIMSIQTISRSGLKCESNIERFKESLDGKEHWDGIYSESFRQVSRKGELHGSPKSAYYGGRKFPPH